MHGHGTYVVKTDGEVAVGIDATGPGSVETPMGTQTAETSTCASRMTARSAKPPRNSWSGFCSQPCRRYLTGGPRSRAGVTPYWAKACPSAPSPAHSVALFTPSSLARRHAHPRTRSRRPAFWRMRSCRRASTPRPPGVRSLSASADSRRRCRRRVAPSRCCPSR